MKISTLTQYLLLVTIVSITISCSSTEEGCNDPSAINYDETATTSADCLYGGCTDVDAFNFLGTANFEDGSCIYPFTKYLGNYSGTMVCIPASGTVQNAGIDNTNFPVEIDITANRLTDFNLDKFKMTFSGGVLDTLTFESIIADLNENVDSTTFRRSQMTANNVSLDTSIFNYDLTFMGDLIDESRIEINDWIMTPSSQDTIHGTTRCTIIATR